MSQIKCKAAVAFDAKKPLEIVDILIDPPKSGEVRIKVLANALCHTDVYTLDGHDPEGLFPCILGHEATGVIEAIGPDVKSVKIGNLVIPCYTPQCKSFDCTFCASNQTNLCPKIRATQGQGLMPDGTSRLHLASDSTKSIYHFMGCSTFAEFAVLAEISVAKISPLANPYQMCLLGCGVSTGWGAVFNNAQVTPQSTVAVFGLGALGLAVIQAAVVAGATTIVGVDLNEKKFATALTMGATECVHADKCSSRMAELCRWGVHFTFDCTGNVDVMRKALELAHRGFGKSCIIGVAASGQEISTRPFQLITGRQWCGTAFGGWKSRSQVPLLTKAVLRKQMNLAPFISHNFSSLSDVNGAIAALHSGSCLRAVVKIADYARPNASEIVDSVELKSCNKLFDGYLMQLAHRSIVCNCTMTFSIYLPTSSPLLTTVRGDGFPVLYFLSGLTCSDENARTKGGFAEAASKEGLAVVFPDTSPRSVPTEDSKVNEDYRVGSGAGWYVNATKKPWSAHFRMDDYVTKELPEIISTLFPVDNSRQGIMGHSMGGHGALTLHLRNPGRYMSVSALAPCTHPTKSSLAATAFSEYFNDPTAEGINYDAVNLLGRYDGPAVPILVDQGTLDDFINELMPDTLTAAAAKWKSDKGYPLTMRMQPLYDHSYFFVSTFMADHVRHHAKYLTA